MKKIAILFVLIGLTTPPLFAASLTDATKPLGHAKFSATVEDNYISDREIKKSSTDSIFDLEEINQAYGKISLGLTPYFNLYTKLGISNCGHTERQTTTALKYGVKTEEGFLWGVGMSGAKKISERWKVGLDAQFNSWEADVREVKYASGSTSNASGKIEDYEVQGTLFITASYIIQRYEWAFNPYVGVKGSYFKTKTDGQIKFRDSGGTNQNTSWALTGKNNVGGIVGTELEFTQDFGIYLEGRFVDETAMTLGGTLRF